GWDWIPTVRGRDIGIWDDVYLSFRGPVSLKDPFVHSVLPLPDTTYADVFIEATLVNDSPEKVSGRLAGSFGEQPFASGEISLGAGRSLTVKLPALHIDEPRLWWPRGYGEPYLYDVKMTFETAGGVSDSCSFKSGIRRMDYKVEPFTPSPSIAKGNYPMGDKPERLCLYVNGRRFIGFGGNWGFPEMLLNYRGREYDTAVEYHADMNFTLIRNWVGQTGDREFYEACDRHGVMVWQDFWLANPYDGPDPYDEGRFNETAARYVRRIRNHPSIAIYVGRNEGFPPEGIDSHLRKTVAEEHPGIYYWPHSAGYQLSGGGPYNRRPPEEYFSLFGQDRLHSERDMPNAMNYENMVRAFGKENIEPVSTMEHPNRMYGLHDWCLGMVPGASSAQRTDTFNKAIEKAFGEPSDARQFSRWAQWINYEGNRAMFEGRSTQRRGLLLWMSHPAWPSMVWQTYDYYFEPTAAYFGCKKACEPVHILYNPVKKTVEAVNYRGGDLGGLEARAEILGLDGKALCSGECRLDLPEDSTAECFPVDVPSEAGEVWFLRLKLLDADGRPVSENFYWQGREEGDYKALLKVGKAKVGASADWKDSGECFEATVRLENNSRRPAMMLRLKATDPSTGDLVLPVFYSDNYFFLMPGEKKQVTVRVRKEDCASAPRLRIEGFNVKEKNI
ncbi:MAG: beta-glycosidase, partial [Bacteroidales bacterium]|nr:beta-glycosidase [Bacteroidales bacterium]